MTLIIPLSVNLVNAKNIYKICSLLSCHSINLCLGIPKKDNFTIDQPIGQISYEYCPLEKLWAATPEVLVPQSNVYINNNT